jgi:predicted ribosomally synthesized peptide with nif11-like leader
MEAEPAEPMSLQQLEAFLELAQADPSLQAPLAAAPDASAVAAIAHQAGFAVTAEDLLAAAGEPPEVVAVIEWLAAPVDPPQPELDAFLQQVELDPDLQRVLAAAPDAEGVAALARIAGYGVTAEEVWEASDEPPLVLEVVSYTLNMDGVSMAGASMAGADGNPGASGNPEAGEAVLASATATAAGASTTTRASAADDRDTWPPGALESFLRQAELDPDLQQALATAADAAAVAAIARAAGHPVTEAVIWEASDETPEALMEPEPPTALADPWASEGSESSGKQV